MKYKVGLIGGDGKMGTFFQPLLKKHFESVICSSSDEENKDIIEKVDIVIVTVPIAETISVIDSIAPLMKKEQLLMDFTSLKVNPVKAMLASKASVIGLHPMFGPMVNSIKGQTVVVCLERPGDYGDTICSFLNEIGAYVFKSSAEEHDRMMALVQGVTHFTSLVFAKSLQESGMDFEKITHFASPAYRMQLYLSARILSQSSNLYRDIQMENPFIPEVLEGFKKSEENLFSIIKEKDKDAWLNYFTSLSEYASSIKKEGAEFTEKFIDIMADS